MSQQDLKIMFQKAVVIAIAMIMTSLLFSAVIYYLLTLQGNSEIQVAGAQKLGMMNWASAFSLILASLVIKNIVLKKSSDNMLNRLMTATIITLALCEGVVLLGSCIAFITRDVQNLYVAFVCSFFGFAFHFPRLNDWERKISEA